MNSGATHLFGSISFFKKNDQRMFTLIAKNIFYWRLDTKILGEDWILQIYRGFSGVPASPQFL
jgi:hypothetical protein